jgi:hypothetical protein
VHYTYKLNKFIESKAGKMPFTGTLEIFETCACHPQNVNRSKVLHGRLSTFLFRSDGLHSIFRRKSLGRAAKKEKAGAENYPRTKKGF